MAGNGSGRGGIGLLAVIIGAALVLGIGFLFLDHPMDAGGSTKMDMKTETPKAGGGK
ncbi:MAG: hypothetical protein AB7F96_10170 [Beijerinckiaceae bacterium]